MQTVLITGASRGIGACTAALFASKGWRVALHYHRSEGKALALAEALQSQGHEVLPVRGDIADSAQVNEMVQRVLDKFGRLDVLINNAGIAEQKLFTDITDADWERMLHINLSGAFYASRAVLPVMIRRKSGRILNVSSIWGMVGASCEVHYSAAKAGLIGLTKALAQEVAPSGIQVNCVAPGVIRTDMTAGFSPEELSELAESTPLGRLGEPEDIARTLLFLASPEAEFITGQVISPNGGFVIT